MTQAGRSRAGFIPELDGLRAVAIILVFLHHSRAQLPVVNMTTFYLGWYVGQGWMGVDLFFVLSGFLITGILLETRETSNYFTGFYARRVLRIFPLYYLVLTAVIIGGRLLNVPKITATLPVPQDRWLYFCYLMNWVGLWKGRFGANSIGHFWSLAVEEQFYVVWPLIVWMVRPRTVPWIAGGLALVAALSRLLWVAHGGSQISIAWATVSRMDELFVGALCACLFRDRERMLRIRKRLPWIACLGVGSFFFVYSSMLFFPGRATSFLYSHSAAPHTLDSAVLFFLECGGYIPLELGFGALVLLAAHRGAESTWMQKFLKSRVLAPIGRYSYGIYVFHVPIIGVAAMFVFKRISSGAHSYGETLMAGSAYIVTLAAVIFAISALSYEFFEKRVLRLKCHFEPRYSVPGNEAAPTEPMAARAAIASSSK
jgi:peptidoglycan/LPS O-acetylase OafA/YrhL